MREFLQLLNVVLYFGLAYFAVVALVWLVTRDEPSLWTVRDLALRPALFVLSPFGIKIAPQAQRPEVRENLERERNEEASSTAGSGSQFRSIRAAKEYLIGRILVQAGRDGVSLTEVEQKMLYFSETGGSLPGIAKTNEEFERDYDQDEYEEKIAGIIRSLLASATPEEEETWDDAVLKLCEGDHYLLVLIDAAGPVGRARNLRGTLRTWLPSANRSAQRPRGDLLRLVIVAIFCGAALMALIALLGYFGLRLR